MCSPSPPPAPDYAGAAQATAAGNLDAARATTAANRVNQITPNGTLTYNMNGKDSYGNDLWTATTAYSPEQQALYDSQNALSKQYAGIAQQGINAIQPLLSNPNLDTSNLPSNPGGIDYSQFGNIQKNINASGVPSIQGELDKSGVASLKNSIDTSGIAKAPVNAGMTAQNAIMSRLQPQIERENQQSDAQLANQGIMQGSEAYNNAKTLLAQKQNDLLNQAAASGVGIDLTANNQGFNQAQNQAAFNNQANQQGMQNALAELTANNAANQQGFGQAYQQGMFGNQAIGQEFNQANQAQSQQQNIYNAALQNAAYKQQQPLNIVNALRTGAQVQSPQFQQVPMQSNVLGPDYMGAAQGQNQYNMGLYNSQVGQNNARLNAATQLGGAFMLMP